MMFFLLSFIDLMLPGVILSEEPGPRMFDGIKKDVGCCVKTLGNK
jgi:hypothetical protein